MILYGIPTCDTCKKAIKASEAEIDKIVQEFGDLAVNKQSTTYRAFNDYLKVSDPEAQIAAQPAVMKRPVIEADGRWFLGWDDKVQTALL